MLPVLREVVVVKDEFAGLSHTVPSLVRHPRSLLFCGGVEPGPQDEGRARLLRVLQGLCEADGDSVLRQTEQIVKGSGICVLETAKELASKTMAHLLVKVHVLGSALQNVSAPHYILY